MLQAGNAGLQKNKEDWHMNEKIYKTMSRTGACSLTLGIVTLITGVVTGIMMIVCGAKLLKRKSEILI